MDRSIDVQKMMNQYHASRSQANALFQEQYVSKYTASRAQFMLIARGIQATFQVLAKKGFRIFVPK